MRINAHIRTAGFIVFLTFLGINLSGQDRNELINVYNAGAKAAQTNVDSAIIYFENALSITDKLGESADDIKQNITKVLPGLYLKSASTMYTAKKSDADVIQAARKASSYAGKFGNAPVAESANRLLQQTFLRSAGEHFKNKEYDKALAAFDSVLSVNPNYNAALYNKALIYRTQGDSEAFEQTIDLYLTKMPSGDEKASRMALEYFRAAGSQANQSDQLDEALNLLNKAAKYGEDKDLYYYFADVYNKQKNFDQGAEAAQKGLALETGNAEAKAKFYFQLGLAQEGKGQTAEACESFKNALFGPFAEPSKAKRTNLKCQ
jgi:tetratricopeptide (TPR) repeat protein